LIIVLQPKPALLILVARVCGVTAAAFKLGIFANGTIKARRKIARGPVYLAK
jgi:hypothetical protein